MAVTYRILGDLEVAVDGRDVRLGGAKEQSVLAILLLHANQVVSSDALIDQLWGDDPPASASNTLQAYVSRLRKTLHSSGNEVLVTKRPGYVLLVEDAAIDADVFSERVEEGRRLLDEGRADESAEVLRAALEMWRGPALSGFEYDDFATAEIARLDELRLLATEARIEADLERGRHEAVIPELEYLTEQHPLREHSWRSLMLALYRAGRQGDALRAYQSARRTLGEELGIEPSPELAQLEEAILLQDPTLELAESAPVSAGNLPAEMTSFVGREEDTVAVSRLLESSRLVTLLGVGGVGKTRLAIWLARGLQDRFGDGVWLVDFSGVNDPAHVPTVVAAVLSPGDQEAGKWQGVLRSIRDRELLIVLDNCEGVGEGVASIAEEILTAAPGVQILATSRQPLEVRGEVLWRLNPLAIPEVGSKTPTWIELMGYESVRLFAERAAAADPTGVLGDQDARHVAGICRLLEGVPLAIELAAARVRHMTVAEIEVGLDDRFRLLVGATQRAPRRHRTLEATIAWSHDQLDPAERELFERLGVFNLEFPAEAAEVVCSGEGIHADEVRDLLSRLADKSLVLREERNGRTWYRLLDSISTFAYDRVGKRGLKQHARGFVIGIAQRTDPRLRGSEERMWSALLSGDRDLCGMALEVASNSFREDEGAFLAGVAAARATSTGRVGFLGGVNPAPREDDLNEGMATAFVRNVMARFSTGFRAGVHAADTSVSVDEVYLTEQLDMATAFRSPALFREAALGLFERGTDVVFHAAGLSGSRLFEGARRVSEDTGIHRWGIGVDYDEYLLSDESTRPHVLASVVKQVPIEVYTGIKAAVLAGAQDRSPVFDLGNEGVRLATTGGHLGPVEPELDDLRAQICSGAIALEPLQR